MGWTPTGCGVKKKAQRWAVHASWARREKQVDWRAAWLIFTEILGSTLSRTAQRRKRQRKAARCGTDTGRGEKRFRRSLGDGFVKMKTRADGGFARLKWEKKEK